MKFVPDAQKMHNYSSKTKLPIGLNLFSVDYHDSMSFSLFGLVEYSYC